MEEVAHIFNEGGAHAEGVHGPTIYEHIDVAVLDAGLLIGKLEGHGHKSRRDDVGRAGRLDGELARLAADCTANDGDNVSPIHAPGERLEIIARDAFCLLQNAQVTHALYSFKLASQLEEDELRSGPADVLDAAAHNHNLVGALADLNMVKFVPEGGNAHRGAGIVTDARVLESFRLL